jgi:hypothetical protein
VKMIPVKCGNHVDMVWTCNFNHFLTNFISEARQRVLVMSIPCLHCFLEIGQFSYVGEGLRFLIDYCKATTCQYWVGSTNMTSRRCIVD